MDIPTVPLKIDCGCKYTRSIPLHMVSDTLAKLREIIDGEMDADTPIQTFRCRHCKEIVELTAKDLYLV